MLFTSETYLTRHDKVTDVCTTNICDTEIGFSITGRTKKKPWKVDVVRRNFFVLLTCWKLTTETLEQAVKCVQS